MSFNHSSDRSRRSPGISQTVVISAWHFHRQDLLHRPGLLELSLAFHTGPTVAAWGSILYIYIYTKTRVGLFGQFATRVTPCDSTSTCRFVSTAKYQLPTTVSPRTGQLATSDKVWLRQQCCHKLWPFNEYETEHRLRDHTVPFLPASTSASGTKRSRR